MNTLSFRELFAKAVQDKFGTTENIELLETKLSHLRKGEPIRYDDLKVIDDESIWPFKKFWSWPQEEEIKEDLKKTGALLYQIAEDYLNKEKFVISSLNKIFRNISLVSIILRFVFPEYYGIYSPPVLYIIGVERGKNAVEEYINYLKVLREIKDMYEIREYYQVERVADVDMLLLAVALLGPEYTDEFNNIYWKACLPEKTYLIEFTPDFYKSTEAHDKSTKAGIYEAIYNLSKNPTVIIGDTIKPLTGYKKNLWRYRLNKFRLIYDADDRRKVVRLVYFDKREDIYDSLERKFGK